MTMGFSLTKKYTKGTFCVQSFILFSFYITKS